MTRSSYWRDIVEKKTSICVVIVPIWKTADEKAGVLDAVASIQQVLKTAGIKVKVDDSEQRTPGWKFNFWEMKIYIAKSSYSSGYPFTNRSWTSRCNQQERGCIEARHPWKARQGFWVSMEPSSLVDHVKRRLEDIQSSLLQRATSFRDSNIVDVSSYGELKEAIAEGKWARGPWSASDAEELKVKEETGATIRCFPFDQPEGHKKCFMSGNSADEVAIFAKSY
uniref:proline--tRNA ligase n=1 Tax=Ananas comosus var. bracteatus TaxID=296719 RepID=A0A6V7NN61_ANACO|nr:unnamed protein product [Ananas comosus var. bracteatus]